MSKRTDSELHEVDLLIAIVDKKIEDCKEMIRLYGSVPTANTYKRMKAILQPVVESNDSDTVITAMDKLGEILDNPSTDEETFDHLAILQNFREQLISIKRNEAKTLLSSN